MENHRIYKMSFNKIYPAYVAKVEKKGRTKAELDEVIEWLTGLDVDAVKTHLDAETTVEDFFAAASMHDNAELIKGVVCGVRVEDVPHPLMKKIRQMDKLVDELAKGKAMEKILR